jgi:molecular chaperone DnaK (HSP70)
MNDKLHPVIGIDLGTTYSAVAAFSAGSEDAEIILNRDTDQPTTPSVVGIDPFSKKVIVGEIAKRSIFDPTGQPGQKPIIEIKREMGEVFSDETLKKFNAQNTGMTKDDPVKVFFVGNWMLPQEISAFTLMKMKEVAEKELGIDEIRDAVVTVPAYFTERQRNATREAALLAGLYPRQLIPEPTAAAISYGLDKDEAERKIYLVYDLGGGTFDVSIIEVMEGNINVIATHGNSRLGGGDFDDDLAKWISDQLKESNLNINEVPFGPERLKEKAEQAKIILSTFETTEIALGDIFPKNPVKLNITRDEFLNLIEPLLKDSLECVKEAIAIAEEKDVSAEDISAVLLVGGSTRIPRIKELLLDYFDKDEEFVRSDANPDAIVARGAAIMAYSFAPSPKPFDITQSIDHSLVNIPSDDTIIIPETFFITEHSLGVEVKGKIFSKIVERGHNIPCEEKEEYTNEGPSSDIPLRIYQGEGEKVFENTLIGTMHLGPFEPKPAGAHKFEVTFALDKNGLLHATVHHINEGKKYEATFDHEGSVEGIEALPTIRQRLLDLYASSKAAVPPQPEQPVHTAPSQAAEEKPVPPPGPGKPPPPPETASPQPAEPSTQSAEPAPSTGANDIIEVKDKELMPKHFQSIYRRSLKQLLKDKNLKLLQVFNEFTTAINNGVSEDELLDLYDELEDAYHDARQK